MMSECLDAQLQYYAHKHIPHHIPNINKFLQQNNFRRKMCVVHKDKYVHVWIQCLAVYLTYFV